MKKHLRHYLVRLKGNVSENINRIRTVKSIFYNIYQNHKWGDKESVSGTGSKLVQTQKIAALLPGLFQRYKIQTVLDIPCGDFNWMQYVDLSAVRYLGADIIEPLIENHNRLHKTDRINFFVANIIEDSLPQSDLIFCRDCLVHFSDRNIKMAISNIKRSNSVFLITTTFPDHKNFNIVTGSWRPANLEDAPFFSPKPLALFKEDYHQEDSGISDKSLGLWRIADLP